MQGSKFLCIFATGPQRWAARSLTSRTPNFPRGKFPGDAELTHAGHVARPITETTQ